MPTSPVAGNLTFVNVFIITLRTVVDTTINSVS